MSRTFGLVAAGIGVLALGLAGCGSDSGSSNPPAGGTASTTVALRTIDSTGDTLTDSVGRTLYMTDQDSASKLACDNQACTSLWKPLLVASGQKPTGPSNISAKLSTAKRPDGTLQVTFDGMPLYTFTMDKSPGETTGNGAMDSFGGPELTWHAVTPSGPASTQSTTKPYDDGGANGY